VIDLSRVVPVLVLAFRHLAGLQVHNINVVGPHDEEEMLEHPGKVLQIGLPRD